MELITGTIDHVEKKAREAWEELAIAETNIEFTLEAANFQYKNRQIQIGLFGMRWRDKTAEKTYNENFRGATWVVVNVPRIVWGTEADLKGWFKKRLERAAKIITLCLEGDLYSEEGSEDHIEI